MCPCFSSQRVDHLKSYTRAHVYVSCETLVENTVIRRKEVRAARSRWVSSSYTLSHRERIPTTFKASSLAHVTWSATAGEDPSRFPVRAVKRCRARVAARHWQFVARREPVRDLSQLWRYFSRRQPGSRKVSSHLRRTGTLSRCQGRKRFFPSFGGRLSELVLRSYSPLKEDDSEK